MNKNEFNNLLSGAFENIKNDLFSRVPYHKMVDPVMIKQSDKAYLKRVQKIKVKSNNSNALYENVNTFEEALSIYNDNILKKAIAIFQNMDSLKSSKTTNIVDNMIDENTEMLIEDKLPSAIGDTINPVSDIKIESIPKITFERQPLTYSFISEQLLNFIIPMMRKDTIKENDWNDIKKYKKFFNRFDMNDAIGAISTIENMKTIFSFAAVKSREINKKASEAVINVTIGDNNSGQIQIGGAGNVLINGKQPENITEHQTLKDQLTAYAQNIAANKFSDINEQKNFVDQFVSLAMKNSQNPLSNITSSSGKKYMEIISKITGAKGYDINAYANVVNGSIYDRIYNYVKDYNNWSSIVSAAVIGYGVFSLTNKIFSPVNMVISGIKNYFYPQQSLSTYESFKEWGKYLLYGSSMYNQLSNVKSPEDYVDWQMKKLDNSQTYAQYLIGAAIGPFLKGLGSNIYNKIQNTTGMIGTGLKAIVDLYKNVKPTNIGSILLYNIIEKAEESQNVIQQPIEVQQVVGGGGIGVAINQPIVHKDAFSGPGVIIGSNLNEIIIGRDRTEMIKTASIFIKSDNKNPIIDGAFDGRRIPIQNEIVTDEVKKYVERVEHEISANYFGSSNNTDVEEKEKKSVVSYLSQLSMGTFVSNTLSVITEKIGIKPSYSSGCSIILNIFSEMNKLCGFDSFFNMVYYKAMENIAEYTKCSSFLERITDSINNILEGNTNVGTTILNNQINSILDEYKIEIGNYDYDSDLSRLESIWNRLHRYVGDYKVFDAKHGLEHLNQSNIKYIDMCDFLSVFISKDYLDEKSNKSDIDKNFNLFISKYLNSGSESILAFDFKRLIISLFILSKNIIYVVELAEKNDSSLKILYETGLKYSIQGYGTSFDSLMEQILTFKKVYSYLTGSSSFLGLMIHHLGMYSEVVGYSIEMINKIKNQKEAIEIIRYSLNSLTLESDYEKIISFYKKQMSVDWTVRSQYSKLEKHFHTSKLFLSGIFDTYASFPYLINQMLPISSKSLEKNSTLLAILPELKYKVVIPNLVNRLDMNIESLKRNSFNSSKTYQSSDNVFDDIRELYKLEQQKYTFELNKSIYENPKHRAKKLMKITTIDEEKNESVKLSNILYTELETNVSYKEEFEISDWFQNTSNHEQNHSAYRCSENNGYKTFNIVPISESDCIYISTLGLTFETRNKKETDISITSLRLKFDLYNEKNEKPRISFFFPRMSFLSSKQESISIRGNRDIISFMVKLFKDSVSSHLGTSATITIPKNISTFKFAMKIYFFFQIILQRFCSILGDYAFNGYLITPYFSMNELQVLKSFTLIDSTYKIIDIFSNIFSEKNDLYFKDDYTMYKLLRILANSQLYEKLLVNFATKIKDADIKSGFHLNFIDDEYENSESKENFAAIEQYLLLNYIDFEYYQTMILNSKTEKKYLLSELMFDAIPRQVMVLSFETNTDSSMKEFYSSGKITKQLFDNFESRKIVMSDLYSRHFQNPYKYKTESIIQNNNYFYNNSIDSIDSLLNNIGNREKIIEFLTGYAILGRFRVDNNINKDYGYYGKFENTLTFNNNEYFSFLQTSDKPLKITKSVKCGFIVDNKIKPDEKTNNMLTAIFNINEKITNTEANIYVEFIQTSNNWDKEDSTIVLDVLD